MSPHWEGPDDAPTAIDLCSGCGGFSYGIGAAGFRVRAMWEVSGPARYTYHTHLAQYMDIAMHGDVRNVDPSKVPDDLDLLGGGPPCQGLSSSGGEITPDDDRNEIAFAVLDWVDACTPKLAVIENVTGLPDRHGQIHSALVDELETAGPGYTVQTLILNAADYGVPQKRERVFIVGVREDLEPPDRWDPPRPYGGDQRELTDFAKTGDGNVKGYRTVREAFEEGGDGPLPKPIESQRPETDPVHGTVDDLVTYRDDGTDVHRVDPHSVSEFIERDGEEIWMPPNHVATNHSRSVRERMAEMPLGYSGDSTTERRLHPDEPAPTITVSNGTMPVHYIGRSPENPNAPVETVRRLTVREVARIQTFPPLFVFAGNKREQFRQVANAVPPLLAQHLAAHLKERVLETEANQQAVGARSKATATDGGEAQ